MPRSRAKSGPDLFTTESHTFISPQFRGIVKQAIEFFESTPIVPLPPSTSFVGAGVYALYYTGGFSYYAHLSDFQRSGFDYPIYIGKAVPPGWRTGRSIGTTSSDLFRRLTEHSRSIAATRNLAVKDFRARFMILAGPESDLVVPIEARLIRAYGPLWNSIVDGFGNHDPGAGRYNQAKSEWDVLHPGRSWANRLKGTSPTLASIQRQLDLAAQQFSASVAQRRTRKVDP